MQLSVLHDLTDKKDREDDDYDLENIEPQNHVVDMQNPAQSNGEWEDHESDLQAGADRDRNGEVHTVFALKGHSCSMLGSVSGDRDQNQTDLVIMVRVAL